MCMTAAMILNATLFVGGTANATPQFVDDLIKVISKEATEVRPAQADEIVQRSRVALRPVETAEGGPSDWFMNASCATYLVYKFRGVLAADTFAEEKYGIFAPGIQRQMRELVSLHEFDQSVGMQIVDGIIC